MCVHSSVASRARKGKLKKAGGRWAEHKDESVADFVRREREEVGAPQHVPHVVCPSMFFLRRHLSNYVGALHRGVTPQRIIRIHESAAVAGTFTIQKVTPLAVFHDFYLLEHLHAIAERSTYLFEI